MSEFLAHPLIIVFVLTPISIGVTFLCNLVLHKIRKQRAYHRLVNDPYVYEGSHLIKLKGSGDVPVIDAECFISHLEFGRMEVTVEDKESIEYGCVYTFTGLEFEDLIPVFKVK